MWSEIILNFQVRTWCWSSKCWTVSHHASVQEHGQKGHRHFRQPVSRLGSHQRQVPGHEHISSIRWEDWLRGRSFAELTNIEFKPEIGTWPWAPVIQVCLLFSNLNFCLNHKPLPIVKIFLSICVIEALLLPPRSGIYLPCVYTYESFQLQKT